MATSKGVLTFWLLALIFRSLLVSLCFFLQHYINAVLELLHFPTGLIM